MSTRYDTFHAERVALAGRLTRIANVAAAMGAPERAQRLAEARRALERDNFRILVLGEFKRGKSTLLNAMLGEAVLPAKVAPCTGLFIELRWGEAPRAVLRRGGEAVEVPVAELREHVVIREEEDQRAPAAEWSHLELTWPLPLLQNHVELVDSPGLNEHALRDAQVLDYLPRADALLFVLSCEQQLSATEVAFLDAHVGQTGVRHAFFAWNRYDAVAGSPPEEAALQALSARALEPRLAVDPSVGPRIFYVSARDALRARRSGDDGALEASGLPALERALEVFLTGERAAVKLSTPRRTAQRAVHELLAHHLPAREELFREPVEAQRRRFLELSPRLERLSAEREAVLRVVERRRGLLARELGAAWAREVEAIAAALPELAAGVELSAWDTLWSSQEARKRVAERLQAAVEKRIVRWQEEQLGPLCERHVQALTADLDVRLGELLRTLGELRGALSPGVAAPTLDGAELDPLSRVLGAVGGFFLGGVGAAMEGARGGVGGMLRGLGYHVALGVGLVLLGATAPVVMAASAVLGVVRLLAGGQGEAAAVREQVVGALAGALRADLGRVQGAAEERLVERFGALERALDAGLRVMIEDVAGQLASVVAAREAGEAALAAERERIGVARAELGEVAEGLA